MSEDFDPSDFLDEFNLDDGDLENELEKKLRKEEEEVGEEAEDEEEN